MRVVPYTPDHLLLIEPQAGQAWASQFITPKVARDLQGPHAFTVIGKGELVLACAGLAPLDGQGRYLGWSFLSALVTPADFIWMHNRARLYLRTFNARRVEIAVDCEFDRAHRWARALGFTLEAPRMRAYEADGRDCALYALTGGS